MNDLVKNGNELEPVKEDQLIETGITVDRLLSAYFEIAGEDSIPYMLAYLLSTAHDSMGTALNYANMVNDLQGKNRVTASNLDDTFRNTALEDYSYSQTDMVVDLYVEALNLYLEDKQQLPTKTRQADYQLNLLKALFIILISNGQYILVSKLNIPDYMEIYIETANKYLDDLADELYEDFISYVEQAESQEVADYFRELGGKIWGSVASNARDIFNSIINPILDQVKNWTELRNRWLNLREEYFKVTRSIKQNKLFGSFEISKTTFDKYKLIVIEELGELLDNVSDSLNLRDLIL